MKKLLYSIILLLSVLCFSVDMHSQEIVEIGDGARTSYDLPIRMDYNYSFTQQIFNVEDIGIAGTISSVGFYYDYTSPFSMSGILMYMMHTAKSEFVDGRDVIALDSATLVYDGDFAATEPGWFTLSLDTPFEYNGIDNLLICMYDTTNGHYDNNYKFRCSYVTNKTVSLIIYGSSQIPDISNIGIFNYAVTWQNDIQLGITPATGHCFRPSSVSVSDVTAHGAYVSWTAEDGESAWQICLNDDENNLIDVNSNAYELTGLTSETLYNVKVRVSCGNGSYSNWTRNISFTTLISCFRPTNLAVSNIGATTASLSWSEGSNETAWQICINNDEDSLIDINANSYDLAELTPETTYNVKVRANCAEEGYSNWTSNVSFTTIPLCPVPTGLSVTRGKTTAFVTWEAGGNETEWQICLNDDEENIIDVDSNEYTFTGLSLSTNYRVKVRANCDADGYSNWTSNWYFATLSNCPPPENFTCSPSVYSATLSWTPAYDETMWNIQYKATSADHYTCVNGITSTTYTLTGLNSGTDYFVEIQSNCDSDWTAAWRTLEFSTKYGIPFVEDFATSIPDWSKRQGLLSSVMDGGYFTSTSSSGWGLSSSNGVFDKHAIVNLWGNSRKEWLITPNIVMDDCVQLSFDLALTQFSGTLQPVNTTQQMDDKFAVLISTDNGATWTILRQYDNAGSEYVYNNIATAGETVIIGLTDYSSDYVKIAFYGESTVAGGDVNVHIDNVRLDYIKPLNLTASNITATAADVTWTGRQDVEWELKYGISGFDVESEGTSVENIAQTSYSITGLLANTSYDVYVKAVCRGGGDDEWVMVSFVSGCGIQAIPYTENLDGITLYNSSRIIPRCWERIVSNDLYPYIVGQSLSTTTSHSGLQAICMHTSRTNQQNVLALPQMSDINTLMISFWARYNDSVPENFQVGYVANGEFTPLESFALTTNYRQYIVLLNDVSADAERIAICLNDPAGGSFVYVDDVEVVPIVSCPSPINVEVSNITNNSAVISWTPVGDETAWQYTMDDGITWNDFATAPVGTTTKSYTFTGLDAATGYTIKIRAYCSDSEQSEASSEVAFYTDICGDDEMCEISYSLSDRFGDSWNDAAINVVDVETGRVLTALTMEIGISNITGTLQVCNGREISFVWSSGSFDNECSYAVYDVNGDEILSGTGAMATVNYMVDCHCMRPSALNVSSITTNSATIIWTAGADETAWQICVNDNEDEIINVEYTTYTLTDLSQDSDYTVKVRANCGESNGVSDWTANVAFTTAAVCPVPTNLRVSIIDANSVDLTWNGWIGQNSWQICINDNEDEIINVEYTTYTLTDLSPELNYTVKVRTNCEEDGFSRWSPDLSFTIFDACTAPNNLSFSNIGMNSATVSWNAIGNENMWQIALNGNLDNIIDVYDNEYTFTGLERDTRYSVVVRSLCDENRYSYWKAGSFSTLARCPSPANLTASIVDTTYAIITWSANVDVTSWLVYINYDFDNAIEVDNPTYTLTNLTEGTEYEVWVRSNCGSEQGGFSVVTFTTLADCYAPNDIYVEANANSANVSWEGTSDSYILRYRAAEINGSYYRDFEDLHNSDGWSTIDNDGDGYCWTSFINGMMDSHSGTGCVSSLSYPPYEISPVVQDNWLVSPRLALNGSLKIWVKSQNNSSSDEHFGIYVSTTGRWSVSDFNTQVLPETIATDEYMEYSVDLSSYNWHLGYIAIRHYNSSGTGHLNIDDFEIEGENVPAGEWVEVETTETSYEITGLEQGVEYDVQIMGICGDKHSIWSRNITLQTLSISATAGAHGAINPSGIITFNRGEDQTFSIIPDEGYRIENVMVDGVSVMADLENNTYTFTNVTEDHTIHATFESVVSVDMTEEPSMSIHPNPNNGMFSIVFYGIEGNVTYQLINVNGAVVETRDINVMDGATMNFNHNLTAGTYFLRIISGEKVYVEQIVVE
ncbi:MAG: fibronectin type III domain-containing protein [Bacteroidales bacterium]|nr:fibronectin type III domain-containing protein [Bacteroidales bacterium]